MTKFRRNLFHFLFFKIYPFTFFNNQGGRVLKNPTKYFFISLILLFLNATALAQTIEEVTVTAARKEQSVQDVAISVQAISGDDLQLQHIETAADLSSTVPGFDFTEALGSGVDLKIRGLLLTSIGSAGATPAITAQNGHQIGNRPFSTIGFYDSERIEILEGPQGTLYGRNSTTGLINFITAKPGSGQYVMLTSGADGLSQLKFARDFELSDTVSMRIAGTKYDKDGVVLNSGTGNDIDDRDSFGIRTTIVAEMDDRNTLTAQLEKTAVNDNRLNFGLSACNRDSFFGCSPLTNDFSVHLNRPVDVRGSIANTFNTLTNINASGSDLFAATDASRISSIDVINKDIDASRKDNFRLASLTNVTELDNMTITLKGTHINQDYRHLDDNDHSNATGALNSSLIPAPAFSIPSVRTFCLGTLTNVTNDFASECSEVELTTNQYEINIVSDFDGPFNFTVGAYDYREETYNQYNIQQLGYLLVNDFDQHPYSTSGLFGSYTPTMNTFGGQAFYGVFAAALLSNQTAIANAFGTDTVTGVGLLQNTVGPGINAACEGLNPAFATNGVNPCVKSMPVQAGGLITDQRTNRNSSAVYGEFYWDALDNVRVTLGARYMDDRFATRTMQGLSDTAYTGGPACLTTNYEECYQQGSVTSNAKNEATTYKFAVQYDYADGMVYASFVTGNRPQGANPDGTVYREAESEQIEIGTRNIFFGGALRLNATFFSQDIEDSQRGVIRFASTYVEPHDLTHEGFQLNLQGFITSSTIISVNALTTDSTFDTEAATTANTSFSASLGYAFAAGSMSLDSQNPTASTSFSNFTRASAVAQTVIAADGTTVDSALQQICGALPAAISRACATVTYATDSSGNYLINPYGEIYAIANAQFAPINQAQGLGTYNVMQEIGGNKVPGTADLETTVTLTQLYQFGGGSGLINLSYHYKDKTFGDSFNNERYASPDTEYFNLNATFEPDNADWYVNVWARNILDKRHINFISKNSNLQGANPFITFDEGRKMGLDFGYNF